MSKKKVDSVVHFEDVNADGKLRNNATWLVEMCNFLPTHRGGFMSFMSFKDRRKGE